MKKDPILSIVVPNYNNVEYIALFIESVQNQLFKDWEMIIVDDGSTNNSCMIIESFQKKDNRIKLLHRDRLPKGACTCRNLGLDNSKGKYVCFFDSDDLIPTYSLQEKVQEMESSSSEISFIVFPIISFKEFPFDTTRLVMGLPLFKDDLKQFLKRYRLPFTVCTNIYRKCDLIKFNIRWDERLRSFQDSDFNISALVHGMKYKYSEDTRPHYFWRVGGNEQSITKTIKSLSNFDSQLYFFEKQKSLNIRKQYLYRFGKTLLLRSILCGYGKVPNTLVDKKSTYLRVKMLLNVTNLLHIRNNHLIIIMFALLFPFDYADELFFRIRNYINIKKYFNSITNNL